MSPPVVFAFADPARRTWLALNRSGDAYHVVTPTPDDAQLITAGLRRQGQLSCSCAGGRYRGSCYVTVACEALEATKARLGAKTLGEILEMDDVESWLDAPAGAGEEVT